MVGTGWANSQICCMYRLRKYYPQQLGGSFLAGKDSWVLSGCLPSEDVDYCMLINEWVWLRSQGLLIKSESALRFSFKVKAQTEIKIWRIKGMCTVFL